MQLAVIYNTIEARPGDRKTSAAAGPAADTIDDGLLLAPSCPAQSTAAVSVHCVVSDNAMGVIAYGHRGLQWTALAAVEI